MIRVEKRLPFGFKGDWGKVFKLFTYDEEKENILYQNQNYVEIESEVQFKYLENGIDKNLNSSQPIMNLPTKNEYRIVKTTDAYFNDNTHEFECVVDSNDIVFAFGCYWVVDKVEDKSIFTPNKQTFYYCALKRIFEEVLRRSNVKD